MAYMGRRRAALALAGFLSVWGHVSLADGGHRVDPPASGWSIFLRAAAATAELERPGVPVRPMPQAPRPAEAHLDQALFLGCDGQGDDRICVITERDVTLRLQMTADMPGPFVSFLNRLEPYSPVAVTVRMPEPGQAGTPRLTAIRLRQSALPDRIWRQIQGSWRFDGLPPTLLDLDGTQLEGPGAQRLLGGVRIAVADRCGAYVETGLYLAAQDERAGTVCYRLLTVGPDRLSLLHLPLGDQLDFYRTP